MAQPTYEEDFVNSRVSNDPASIQYVLDQIAEVHSKEAGWVIETPSIVPNPDGATVTITVHLAKYEVQSYGRSR